MQQTSGNSFVNFFKSKWTVTAIIVIIIIIGLVVVSKRGSTKYQFVTVTRGSVTETVSVTGNSTATQSVSIGFQNSGVIAHVYHAIGDQVTAGQVIATLNMSDLSAQVAEAQANLDAENAKLQGLQAGAQPEDIAASQAAVQKAQQDLANMYASISDTSTASYSKANDSVRTQLSAFFTNAETSNPQLTYLTNNSQAQTNAQTLRVSASLELNAWQQQLANASATSTASAEGALLSESVAHLAVIQNLLQTVSTTLDANVNMSASQLATYRANLGAAISEVNTSVSNLNTISQNISSQNLTISQLQAQLALKQAGSTPQDIAAQQAGVEQAQASLQSAQAKLANSEIIAPISGVITQQDAKVGQVADPGTPLVSIISNGQFEVDALVPETDIGKVAVGNSVNMTFDAFPNETFTGKVFYIDPAETITQGVVDYKIKVSFDTPDSRIKSGLTANLDIQTKQDTNALILPQYAVLENDQGTFVETLVNNKASTTPVTLGIQDENGNVEILSGVTEGEQVLNIGLKQ